MFSVIPAVAARVFWGAKLIYDIRDVAKLAVSHRGPAARLLLGAIEDAGIAASSAVIVVDRPLLEAIPQYARHTAFVVPNAPHGDLFDTYHFSTDGRIRINLAGFISARRNLEAWCEAQAHRPGVILDLYGTVADDQARAILARHGISEVNRLTHSESLNRTRLCDAVALMYDPSIGINRFAAPNKYYEALMLGKPVICAHRMGLADEVERWGCGIAVPYADPAALAAALARLAHIDERRRMGARARELFLHSYMGKPEAEMTRLYSSLSLIGVPATPVDHLE